MDADALFDRLAPAAVFLLSGLPLRAVFLPFGDPARLTDDLAAPRDFSWPEADNFFWVRAACGEALPLPALANLWLNPRCPPALAVALGAARVVLPLKLDLLAELKFCFSVALGLARAGAAFARARGADLTSPLEAAGDARLRSELPEGFDLLSSERPPVEDFGRNREREPLDFPRSMDRGAALGLL